MTKTAKKVAGAFLRGEKCLVRNTGTNGTHLYLFGNLIASKTSQGLLITHAGWPTRTTKDRLNALPGVCITQKNWSWYLNGEPWDGSAKIVSQND